MTKNADPVYLSLKQAAEQLGVSRSSITAYLKAGKLAAVEIAGRRVIEATALEGFERPEPSAKHATIRRYVLKSSSLTDDQKAAIIAILDA